MGFVLLPVVAKLWTPISSIVAKLGGLGWGEELALMDPVTEDVFWNLHEVRQRQKLSSRSKFRPSPRYFAKRSFKPGG